MSCKKILPLLDKYLDNELDEQQKKMVDTHLSHCAFCKTSMHHLFQTFYIVNKVNAVDPPIDYSKLTPGQLSANLKKKGLI